MLRVVPCNRVHAIINFTSMSAVSLRLTLPAAVELNLSFAPDVAPAVLSCLEEAVKQAKAQVHGGALDGLDGDGKTALWLGCEGGHESVVDMLLGVGADPGLRSKLAQPPAVVISSHPRKTYPRSPYPGLGDALILRPPPAAQPAAVISSAPPAASARRRHVARAPCGGPTRRPALPGDHSHPLSPTCPPPPASPRTSSPSRPARR